MTIDRGPLAPPALLRTLRTGDAPYPGDLRAGHPPTVWVPLDQLPPELWHVREGEHVLTAVDIARTDTGQAALIPHCPERLSAALARGPFPLSPGGVVTVAVSMLRGAAEAGRCGIADGVWWVDAAGRPVLAATGQTSWRDETLGLLTELAEGAVEPLRQALRDAADLVSAQQPPARRILAVEDALFAAAEPAPLRDDDGSRSPMDPPPRRAASLRPRDEDGGTQASDVAGWSTGLMDGEVLGRLRIAAADIVAAAARGVGSMRSRGGPRAARAEGRTDGRDRARARSRRAPILTAMAVAIAVVAVGLWWPSGEESSDAAVPSAGAAPTSSSAPESTSGAPAAAPRSSASLPTRSSDVDDARVEGILRALASCTTAADLGCDGVLEDATAPPPVGVVADGAVARTVDLLDEYGGVSVYRVAADGLPAQILVLVDVNGRWLVRDVYDVADQP